MKEEKQTGLTEEKSYTFKRGLDTVPELLSADEQKEKATTKAESDEKESTLETNTETLLTTDPQEKMEGPISSIMQTIKEGGEASDVVSKEEANRKKDENT
jgi:hypothetical protein